MRFEKMDKADHEWLNQFEMANFSLEKRQAMNKKGLWVSPSRKAAFERNRDSLVNLNKHGLPMVYTKAKDAGRHAKVMQKCDSAGLFKDVSGLEYKLVLGRGCQVAMTTNHYIHWNLFNGSQGEVVEIIYLNGRAPSLDGDSFPDFYLVQFPGYTGPAVVPWDPKVVPVSVHEAHQDCRCHCSRTQFPLCPNYGRTVHKCQGMTCGPGHPKEYLVADLGTKADEGRWPGVGFVALSRISAVSHLGLSGTVDYDRLQAIGTGEKYKRIRAFDAAKKKLSDEFLERNHFLDNQASLDFLVKWALSFPERHLGGGGAYTESPPEVWPLCSGGLRP
jgi:hypothetical protein